MKRIKIINQEIMTWPQYRAKYEELAVKIANMEKTFTKQSVKIYKILNKLKKLQNEKAGNRI